jgi:hypothetical protein
MKEIKIMTLHASESVTKEEVEEISCREHKNLKLRFLKELNTCSVFKYMCVATIIMFVITTQNLSAQKKNDKIYSFEKEFATTLSSDEQSIKLIGCKRFEIKPEDRDKFKANIEAHKEEITKNKDTFFAEDFSYFMTYFPLSDAIIISNNVQYTANERGLVSLSDSCDISKIKIIGRKKSGKVTHSSTKDTVSDKILFNSELMQGETDGVKTGYSHTKERICVFIFTNEWSM